jgi:hypothetical protein
LYQMQKTVTDFGHNKETMLYSSQVRTNGWPCLKTVTQVPWFWKIDGWLQVKRCIIYTSVWFCSWNHPILICASWIPKELTGEHKCNCLTVC